MSLILDALKKSDSERQRQGNPAMFEVRVAPPRARFPLWAVLLGLLLGVNLVVLIVVLLLRDRPVAGEAPAPPPAAAAAPQAPAGPSQGPADAGSTPVPAAPVSPVAPAAPTASVPPPSLAAAAGSPGGQGAAGLASRFNPPLVAEADPGAEGADPEVEAAGGDLAVQGGAGAAMSGPLARPRGGGVVSGLPDRAALVAAGTPVPEVNVSLHAWDRNPSARWVFIDGVRAGEGAVLASGVRVEQITAEGTVLSFRGSRFLVPIQ